MKRYARYKDSGISWIGEVPEHWEECLLQFLFSERTEKNHPEEPILCATQNFGVIPQSMYENRVVVVNKGFEGLKFVKKGDFVISLRSFQGGIEYAHYQGIISAAYTILFIKDNRLKKDYVRHLFKSAAFVDMLKVCVTGIREGQNINYGLLKKQQMPIPPLSEQKAIADFLDKKTAQINELVAAKKKQIELLKEYKQAVIAKAVTQGVNPKAKMKDSGISWIGQIPVYWMVDKLGHQFVQRKEKVSDKDFAPLSVSKMGVTPQLESACKSDDGDNRKLVCKGDFVVNSRSDRKGSCGFSELDGSVSLINIVATPRKMNGWYCHFLFRSNNYIEEFYRMGRGIVADLWTTRWSEMRTIMIPVPPPEEQSQIVAFIKEKVSAIDSQISAIEKQIANLNEFKQSLISDAVTGKIKVA